MSISLDIHENYSLRSLNTLRLESRASYFIEVHSLEQLQEVLRFSRDCNLPLLPLGKGSNVVFSSDLKAVVVGINLKERIIFDSEETSGYSSLVRAGAGECWHDFVLWTLQNGLYGLENLSLIPGTVGAAPVQNIGAYGVELKDIFHSLEAIELATGKLVSFDAEACHFGYRDSVFKNALCDHFIITAVTFNLDLIFTPKIYFTDLKQALGSKVVTGELTGLQVSQAVCNIRRSKLPDPSIMPNAGSFFKNPIISLQQMKELRLLYPSIAVYPFGECWKLSAGWLIERAGLRGIRKGDLGTFQKQALVIVNHGQASGKDLIEFSENIRELVQEEFGIRLDLEPRVYPDSLY